jgi:hypothetical protein
MRRAAVLEAWKSLIISIEENNRQYVRCEYGQDVWRENHAKNIAEYAQLQPKLARG